MKPEALQQLSQIVIGIGIIFTALGGFGSFYFGQKVEQKNKLIIHNKTDSIPEKVRSKINTNTDRNTEKVIGAINEVKQSIREIKSLDSSNIKEITYPKSGAFGLNILFKGNNNYTLGTYSMKAFIPKNQMVIVKISGKNWHFPLFQSISGWQFYNTKITDLGTSRYFKTVKYGITDLELYLDEIGTTEIEVYENSTEIPIWKKAINIVN